MSASTFPARSQPAVRNEQFRQLQGIQRGLKDVGRHPSSSMHTRYFTIRYYYIYIYISFLNYSEVLYTFYSTIHSVMYSYTHQLYVC